MSMTAKMILKLQKQEITEYHIYQRIAELIDDPENKDVMLQMAMQEKHHYEAWQSISHEEVKPSQLRIRWYVLLARTLGYTFVLKKLEANEAHAQCNYQKIGEEYPVALDILKEEDEHEQHLISMLDEEKLQYVGSMVLGLNDALVELTGTIAGLTFALQNTKLIALSGIVTGISATLSMMSSEYLAKKSSKGSTNPLKASLYTGVMYLLAVVLMVIPYIILPDDLYVLALVMMLSVVILLIVAFTYYISIAQGFSFKQRFLEMFTISMGVALIAFFIGVVVKAALGIDI